MKPLAKAFLSAAAVGLSPGSGLTHTYSSGTYTANVTFDGTAFCSMQVQVIGACGDNAWRYYANYSSIDNSVSQWPSLGLFEAQRRWGIIVNPPVKTEVKGWLAYSQLGDGGFGYSGPDGSGYARTGAGVIMHNWTGSAVSVPAVQAALCYLQTNYYGDNKGDMYAMYAFYKAMKLYGIDTLNVSCGDPIVWEPDYDQYLVSVQNGDGSWSICCWFDTDLDTYVALAILAPAVGSLPPVADPGGPYGPVKPGQDVNFDGSKSYDQDPNKKIVKWEWDFDASDGLWWDTKPAPSNPREGATGETVTLKGGYPDLGHDQTYTVTLRVTDDGVPPATDLGSTTVQVTTGNAPPVAVTNGPWAQVPGSAVIFDGSGSYDPNACPPPTPGCLNDGIVKYEWDLNGDGIFNDPANDGTPVVAGNYSKVTKTFAAPTSGLATLRVTDQHGLTGTSSAQFISIALTFATNYQNCWAKPLDRYTTLYGLRVTFRNQGQGTAQNTLITLTGTPSNLNVVSGQSNLGDLAGGASKTSACDSQAQTADIVVKLDRRLSPSGNWAWKAEFDFNGQHYVIPNLPPLAP